MERQVDKWQVRKHQEKKRRKKTKSDIERQQETI
jgi:hypothetical protein